jgi:hypothetical protein
MRIRLRNSRSIIMASGMSSSNAVVQVQRRYRRPDKHQINSLFPYHTLFAEAYQNFKCFKTEPSPEVLSTAQNLGSTRNCRGYKLSGSSSYRMVRKRSGALLKRELDSLSFLQTHPEVQRHFSNAGCIGFVERLQIGCHQATAEAFAKTFDGNKALVGSMEIRVDEAVIAAATSLPRTGQRWFKTTAPKDLDFRVYLKEGYRHKAWKKGMLVSYLDEEWQELFKGIQLYITSEGRYDKLMMYHFKLLDHFIGKTPLNLPYFLHKSLTKVCKKIRAQPLSMKTTLCHFGLIKLIILEELKQQGRSWEHFLFWEGFETQNQIANEQGKSSKKQSSPQSSSRKRRTLPGPPEDRISGVKPHRLKRKLNFEQTTEQTTEHPTEQSTGKRTNILNLPYSDSESEQQDQCPVTKSPEQSAECAQNYETFNQTEQGETSKSSKSKKSQKIKHLKEVIAQQEVLERVIKERYKKLSDNFAKTNAAFERLAKESVREKKRKKKLTKDYNNLWWLAKRLKRQIRRLKQKLSQKTHPDLKVLAQVVVNMQGEKSETH